MQRCLQLAALGAGHVAPNPMVGAVLVYHDRIIGEGFHQQYGQAHAELNCLNSVTEKDKALIPESILYVSLEPCAHYGKTPPCADLIIRHQVKTVVLGCRDPFVEVDGKGIEKLRAAGITVITSVLETECRKLNRRFFCFHTQNRPYIILKWAQSANGCIAGKNKEQVSISGALTNRLVHRWRTEEAAIAVGTQTALTDNPALTARLWPGKQPIRILLDKQLVVPTTQAIFSGNGQSIIFNLLKEGSEGNLLYVQLKPDADILQQLLHELFKLGIQSVLIEGGTKFLQSFIDVNIWDEARVITNLSLVIPDGYAAPMLKNGQLTLSQQSGEDQVQYFNPS